jgi:DNA-binding NarL/FixJ family response regulator
MICQHDPKLVFLDTNLPDNQTWILLSALKAQHPEIRCLVLVDTIQQQQTARSAGASAALLKGFAAAEFFAIVDKLLRLIN